MSAYGWGAQQAGKPHKHLVGISVVILFHALLVWALVSGLAKKVVQVVIAPIETKVIEEVKKPPPPPEVVVPPEPPAVNTEVNGSIFVIATLKAGRVVQVEVEKNNLRGVADRRVMRGFIAAIETAMKEGYQCAGDAIQIRQEFFFDIK